MREVDEHIEKIADLWISFDLDYATFLICYLRIADKIKQKYNAKISGLVNGVMRLRDNKTRRHPKSP